MQSRLVVIESPHRGNIAQNAAYLRDVARHVLARGDYPYASHAALTQWLDDDIEDERELGITAGFAWSFLGDLRVVAYDLGISKGMLRGVEHARNCNQPLEWLSLSHWRRIDCVHPSVRGLCREGDRHVVAGGAR